eukprot:1253675-Lingulodinium_polyedra.AAC.1
MSAPNAPAHTERPRWARWLWLSTFRCPHCDRAFRAGSQRSARSLRDRHVRYEHRGPLGRA